MDVDKLEKELVTMVEDDKLYWLRNDAKFRAAKDQVSYDEFEQRVKVSIVNFRCTICRLLKRIGKELPKNRRLA